MWDSDAFFGTHGRFRRAFHWSVGKMSSKEGTLLLRNKDDEWEKVTVSFECGVLTVVAEHPGCVDVVAAISLSKGTLFVPCRPETYFQDITIDGPLVDGSMVSFEVQSFEKTLGA